MKTSELAVGTHVAYNRGSRSYPSFVEAYVITHRPKGNRSSYWGPNGNTETVGIAYKNRYSKVPQWDAEWVRPAQLEMLWSEYAETQDRIAKRKAERDAENKRRIKNNKKALAGVPAEVKALFSEWQLECLVEDRTATVSFSMDLLVKLVDAAQKAHPKVKAATVEEEVAAALALLG